MDFEVRGAGTKGHKAKEERATMSIVLRRSSFLLSISYRAGQAERIFFWKTRRLGISQKESKRAAPTERGRGPVRGAGPNRQGAYSPRLIGEFSPGDAC